MKIFHITETEQGNDFGTFPADDEQGALETLAMEAGYTSYAEMCEVAPKGTLRVVDITPEDPPDEDELTSDVCESMLEAATE